ncbi:unnamed protein product [Darwinula stevensoni]|uniref:Dynamin-binding protein n=1 Tax=Darwinula stevensoni TaxID=69355 RepID=A0A7R9AE27_9CRUS|nr:unnamed protein product [Darwinula stevensoni]CAG0901910.1 unnamed protein product [Darwinula stevensoni]
MTDPRSFFPRKHQCGCKPADLIAFSARSETNKEGFCKGLGSTVSEVRYAPGKKRLPSNKTRSCFDPSSLIRDPDLPQVLHRESKQWLFGEWCGHQGKFPSNCVSKLEEAPKLSGSLSLMIAIETFRAEQPGDLSFQKGDLLVYEDKVDENWVRGHHLGGSSKGILPWNHVWKLPPLQRSLTSNVNEVIKQGVKALVTKTVTGQLADELSLKEGDLFIIHEVVLYDFLGEYPGELSCKAGDIVSVIQHVDQQWTECDFNGSTGLVPRAFLNIVVDCDQEEKEVNEARVTQDFSPLYDGNLDLKKGDNISILRQLGGDWCEVRDPRGRVGTFPLSHLEVPNIKILRNGTKGLTPHKGQSPMVPKRQFEKDDFKPRSQSGSSLEEVIDKNLSGLEISLNAVKTHLGSNRNSLNTAIDWKEEAISVNCDKYSRNGFSTYTETAAKVEKPGRPPPPAFTMSQPAIVQVSVEDPVNGKPEVLEELMVIAPDSDLETEEEDEVQEQIVYRGSSKSGIVRALSPSRPAPPIPLPLDERDGESVGGTPEMSSVQVCNGGPKSLQINDAQFLKEMESQRQNVISELVITEREYVRDLKETIEVFHVYDPDYLASLGIDCPAVFSSIFEVVKCSENFLDRIQLAMKGIPEDEQVIGSCFLEFLPEMHDAYVPYCINHDNVPPLIEEYERMPKVGDVIKGGVEKLRQKGITCFDMESMLIKPVQRILKYPLLLNQIAKYTPDGHKDKQPVLEALAAMTSLASTINEMKRRKEIVVKYKTMRAESLTSRISRFNMHSIEKKTNRISRRLTSYFFPGARDIQFDTEEQRFLDVERTSQGFLANVESFISQLNLSLSLQLVVAEDIADYYAERNKLTEVDRFRGVQHLILSQFSSDFDRIVTNQVIGPLVQLCESFAGPVHLISKRRDKLYDYESLAQKVDKNKDPEKSRQACAISFRVVLKEDAKKGKQEYEALNSQLIEELPILCNYAEDILRHCVKAFLHARKNLAGRIFKELLELTELPLLRTGLSDYLESFVVKHNLVCSQMARYSCIPDSFAGSGEKKRKSSPRPSRSSSKKQLAQESPPQPQSILRNFTKENVYKATEDYFPADAMDLKMKKGQLVGVIKKQDPMGGTSRWFVNDGATKGFVPSKFLQAYEDDNPRRPRSMTESQDSSPPPSYMEVMASSQAATSPYLQRHSMEPQPNSQKEHSTSCDEVLLEPSTPNENSQIFEALYPYVKSGDVDMSMQPGDRFLLIPVARATGADSWWYMKNLETQALGYVPASYLRPIAPAD